MAKNRRCLTLGWNTDDDDDDRAETTPDSIFITEQKLKVMSSLSVPSRYRLLCLGGGETSAGRERTNGSHASGNRTAHD